MNKMRFDCRSLCMDTARSDRSHHRQIILEEAAVSRQRRDVDKRREGEAREMKGERGVRP